MPTKPKMQPIEGQSGRNVFPVDPPDAYSKPGQWVDFTDGTKRRIAKVENTVGFGAQGNRYMVTTTILFDDDPSMWQMPEKKEAP